MSLRKDSQEELYSANNVLQGFLPEDDPMMVFEKEIYPAFKDEDFAKFYSTIGRHAIPPAFLARVTLLQFQEDMSDPEAADACVRRLDWKISLHLALEKNTSFDPSSLCRFRRRLKENEAMSLIFDKTVGIAQEKGFIKKRSKQRIDATHIISHVNRISTDLLFRAVKCVVEEIEERIASGKTVCGACSFFQDCVRTNRKTKLTKRVLTVGPDHAFIQERRKEGKNT